MPKPIRAASLGGFLVLTPRQFEVAVGTLLVDLGFRKVRLTGRAGDLAADICCIDEEDRFTVVQCKRYGPGNLVGSRDIQLFIGMAFNHHAANRAIFVTTSDYTAPARQLAHDHGVELWDGADLSSMVSDDPEAVIALAEGS